MSHLQDAGRKAPPNQRPAAGFTLIELMVTVAVVAVLMSVAIPSFTRLLASNRMATQTNELVAGLNLARSEAIRRSQAVTIRAVDDANPIQFDKGWIVFPDSSDGDGSQSGAAEATIRESGALSGKTTVKRVTRGGTAPAYTYTDSSDSDRQYIIFNSRGAPKAGGRSFFKVCDSGNTSVPGRIVQVSVSGKVSLDSSTESCS